MLPTMSNTVRLLRRIGAGTCVAVIGTLAMSPAHAQRFVVVNGQLMNPAQIAHIEQMNCGPIANGSYWYNSASGEWGYAGNPYPQGILGDNCYRPARRPSLSERGMLFSPHDWVR